MRVLIWLTLPILLLAGLLLVITSPWPAVPATSALSHADLERGRELVRDLGLRRLREGQVRRAALTPEDINLGLNVLVRQLGGGAARVTLEDGRLLLHASWRPPWLPRHFDLKLALAPSGPMLLPVELRLGRLPLPAAASTRAALYLLASGEHGPQLALARDMLRRAELIDGKVHLTFIWRGQAISEALKQPGVDSVALGAYREVLTPRQGSQFTPYLGQAFALAAERSASGDAAAENRAAITALAELVLGGRLVGARGIVAAPQHDDLQLGGRADFAQHFMVSALLAASGGIQFSDMVGEYKELSDTREGKGSGFSFTDMAANRAGSRFGEYCGQDAKNARRCQKLLAGSRSSRLFFPELHDLPEFLGETEFKRRFGGVDTPAYQTLLREIDRRIDALPLYQE